MLSSFFAQSKPIHLAAIAMLVFIFFGLFYVFVWPGGLEISYHITHWGCLLIFLFTLGILNFVVKRNMLTRKSSYIIYYFSLFIMCLPVLFERPSILIAGMFIMLALRRIISMRTAIDVQKKIFDAGLWIFVASLFYFWAVLFIFVLYLGVLLHAGRNYKNWLIPLVSLLITFLFATVFSLYSIGLNIFSKAYIQMPAYNYTAYSSPRLLLPITLFLAIYTWCIFRYLALLNSVSQKIKPSYILVLISSMVALVIAVGFSPVHDGSEMYFFFGPLAIITSRYMDKSRSKWFGEMLMVLALITPILMLIFWP